MKQLDESEDPADEVALDARFASLNSKKFRFEISVSKNNKQVFWRIPGNYQQCAGSVDIRVYQNLALQSNSLPFTSI